MKTKVECFLIPEYGLSLTKIGDVCSHIVDCDYMVGEFPLFGVEVYFFCFFCHPFVVNFLFYVDIIGLMTGISSEREYVRDGNKVTKMIVFELTGDRFFYNLFGSWMCFVLLLIIILLEGCLGLIGFLLVYLLLLCVQW